MSIYLNQDAMAAMFWLTVKYYLPLLVLFLILISFYNYGMKKLKGENAKTIRLIWSLLFPVIVILAIGICVRLGWVQYDSIS